MATAAAVKPARMVSIDALRGLTIAFMILVNNNGDEAHAYWPLKHAEWNGFTPTDLVFPTFLFLVGVATVFSTAARLAQGATKMSLFLHTLRRSIIIFLFGQLVNNFPFFHLATWRVYGVLPRIAICYFLVATFYIFFPGWKSKLAAAIAALVGYWVIMRFIPVPGFGVPTHDIPLLDPDRNIVAWLDRQIFSAPHMYEHTRDPEGLISTIPSLATALFGLLTGIWLRTSRTLAEKARGIAIAGLSGVILGGIWNTWFPINKKLWTSSYALWAAGLSSLLLALFIWIVDVRNSRSATPRNKPASWLTPLLVFGSNSIAAYVLSELLASALGTFTLRPGVSIVTGPYIALLHAIGNPALVSLLYSLCFVLVCWIPTYVLYRKRIFLKI
jgi:predicted acyltransferase